MSETKDVSIVQKVKAVSPLVEKAKELVIETPEDMGVANEILSSMNKIIDAATEEKEKITKPALAILSAERKRWKPLEEMFDLGIELLRKKMSKYQTEAKRKAEEEEDALAARVGEGRGKLKPETAIRKMGEIEKPETRISGDKGMTKFRTVPRFEVMDIKKLPVEFLLPNEVAIREAQKEGKEIPGVRYYTEEVPMNFR